MTALWRPPTLRSDGHHPADSPVSWTELFYDLVFVVAIANVGHRFGDSFTISSAIEFVALFGMLWWAWASVTFVVDRYESNDAVARLLAVAQMFAIAAFAAAAAAHAPLDAIAPALAAAYAVTRLVVLAMYARVWWHLEESRPLVGGYLRGFGLDTVLWVASSLVPAPTRYVCWALAMAISLATPWRMRRVQVRSPLSASHLPERFGLFTILVLGEAVAAVVYGLRAEELSTSTVMSAGIALLVATGLWWIYFDNLEGSVVRRDPERRHDWRPTTWIYAHFPLALSIAAAGSGLPHLIAAGDHDGTPTAVTCAVALAGALVALALILISTAGVDASRRRRRALARLAGALAASTLAVASPHLAPMALLSAFGAILVVEVAFDAIEGLSVERAA